jgi:hypothetical protein
MKNKILWALIPGMFSLVFSGCDKLQGGFEYTPSFVDNRLNMTALAFMESRRDAFTGMLGAIEYVDGDPAFKDVKEMYASADAKTFLLLHDDALINPEVATSYWNVNRVMGPNPENPTQMVSVRASDWSQYPRDTVATLLRYHVAKGMHTFQTLTSTPKWVESFLSSPTNDSALVRFVLESAIAVPGVQATNTSQGNLRVNSYVGHPNTYKGVTMGWTTVGNITPRTPDLRPTNGVIHVMNRWFLVPTRSIIQNN